MAGKYAKLFSLAGTFLLVLSIAGIARYTSPGQQAAKPNAIAADPLLKDLARYRQWTRVNEKPRRSNNFLIEGTDG